MMMSLDNDYLRDREERREKHVDNNRGRRLGGDWGEMNAVMRGAG